MLKNFLAFLSGLALFLSGCVSSAPGFVSPQHLAAFSQNSVSVEILFSRMPSIGSFLSQHSPLSPETTCTARIFPATGIYGEGRPTLVELTPRSAMRVVGALTANVNDEVSSMGMDALLIYPAGPVTLKLPVSLPPDGAGTLTRSVSHTNLAARPPARHPWSGSWFGYTSPDRDSSNNKRTALEYVLRSSTYSNANSYLLFG